MDLGFSSLPAVPFAEMTIDSSISFLVLEAPLNLTLIITVMTFSTDGLPRNVPLIGRSLITALRTDLAFRIVPAHDIAVRAEDLLEVILPAAELLRSRIPIYMYIPGSLRPAAIMRSHDDFSSRHSKPPFFVIEPGGKS